MSAAPGQSSAAIAVFLPSLDGGGAERAFVELANEFARTGHRTDLVLASARGPYLGEVSREVPVVDLGAPRVLAALPRLVRYLRANRPQALLSALDHANVVAVLAVRLAGSRTRSVISMRAMPSEIYRQDGAGGSRFLFRCMMAVYPRADAIIANSRAVALDLSQVLALPVDAVPVIHNPLNLARLDALASEGAPHPWLSDGGPPVVLSVGALAPRKDFATLVRAFAIARSRRACRLVILGEGPEREHLAAIAAQSGVAEHVAMPGFLPNPFPWMRRARVFVSSSTTEGCPNALMQALALGTRIVSTQAIGGSAEILEDGRWGRLVPVGGPGAMAEAIVEALDDAHGNDGRARAAAFSHERIARRYLDVLLPAEKSA
jgi:glycosyltransferase involved in cell wall biosynthesis